MATISETLAIAVQHHQAGHLQAAEQVYRQILAVDPNQADALHLLGVIAYQLGNHEVAIEYIGRAIGAKRTEAAFHYNLACVFIAQKKLDEAVACCHWALELKPDFPEVHNHLGIACKEQGKLDEAVACHRRALELKPDYVEALSNLGSTLKDQGNLDEALACYRRALELKPDYAAAHSNLLYTRQYRAGVTLSELAAAHGEYDRLHAVPLRRAWPQHENVRDCVPSAASSRRLRLGFVSPDFGRHPVGYFLIRGLENLDQGQCETVCYSDRIIKDDLTTRFQAATTVWRDVFGLNHEQLAAQIRADRIDILFDLAGHTAGGGRLLMFARKPAPIQITWIGYEGTTGLEAMDYILADRYTIPAGTEASYRERVLRMPHGYVCYDPPTTSSQPGPLPAATNGYLRFGSFNNLAKITPQVVEVWAKVLDRVPQARLVLKYRGLGDESVRERYLGMFTAFGVDPARVELAPPSGYDEYLAAYREVDIALDTFPFGGGITTCDALWMGVPVVACPGETFASRHGLSHLATVGLTETVARDLDEYVDLAVALAGDLSRLAALRAGLRERMASSPLCDGKRFAESFVEILRGVWRDWCSETGASTLEPHAGYWARRCGSHIGQAPRA
jgi:predicted O-linked N-acetylglucosamine transferase (SPINDLY family)